MRIFFKITIAVGILPPSLIKKAERKLRIIIIYFGAAVIQPAVRCDRHVARTRTVHINVRYYGAAVYGIGYGLAHERVGKFRIAIIEQHYLCRLRHNVHNIRNAVLTIPPHGKRRCEYRVKLTGNIRSEGNIVAAPLIELYFFYIGFFLPPVLVYFKRNFIA